MKIQNRTVKRTSLDERIEAFVQLARTAERGLMNACIALLELRQEYPAEELYPKIRKRLPVTEAFLDRMCEAAQKKFPAELLLYASPGASYLQTLPYEKGQQHIKEELPVVVPDEQGFITEYKMFHQLKHREVRQVFDGDRIRSAQEQTLWLNRQRLRHAAPAKPPQPYEIVDGYVLFTKDTKMTADEVELLLRRLRKK
ncbi:MAG: hypothetical protein ACLQU3_28000 [Limisphaerales bacterium]